MNDHERSETANTDTPIRTLPGIGPRDDRRTGHDHCACPDDVASVTPTLLGLGSQIYEPAIDTIHDDPHSGSPDIYTMDTIVIETVSATLPSLGAEGPTPSFGAKICMEVTPDPQAAPTQPSMPRSGSVVSMPDATPEPDLCDEFVRQTVAAQSTPEPLGSLATAQLCTVFDLPIPSARPMASPAPLRRKQAQWSRSRDALLGEIDGWLNRTEPLQAWRWTLCQDAEDACG